MGIYKGERLLMKEILNLLPVLFIAIIMNMTAGIYYNIGNKKMHFNLKKLVSVIIKASIISGLFIGTAYCFEVTDMSATGITPEFIMISAITLYVGKALISLAKILGIETTNQSKE